MKPNLIRYFLKWKKEMNYYVLDMYVVRMQHLYKLAVH